jgi:hypothetical protein
MYSTACVQCVLLGGASVLKASVLQALGLYTVGLVATVCAFAAYAVLAGVLSAGGLPADLAFSPAAFAVFGLAALFNPLYAALLPVLLPVCCIPLPLSRSFDTLQRIAGKPI